MITLEPLSERNFEAVTKLEVAFDQAGFVAPNVFSIAESKIYNYLQPRVICQSGKAVGFALYGLDPESQRYYIVRLMVDARFQGKGIGRTAVRLIVGEIQSSAGRRSVYLSVVPGNERARRLYEDLGFTVTGAVDADGELEYQLNEDGVARLCAAAE